MVIDRNTLLFGGLITPCYEALVAEKDSLVIGHTFRSPVFSESDAPLLPAVKGFPTAGSNTGEMVGLVAVLPGFSILCLNNRGKQQRRRWVIPMVGWICDHLPTFYNSHEGWC